MVFIPSLDDVFFIYEIAVKDCLREIIIELFKEVRIYINFLF
jgi:hypothetical protein